MLRLWQFFLCILAFTVLLPTTLQAQDLDHCLEFLPIPSEQEEPDPEALLDAQFRPFQELEHITFHDGPVWFRCDIGKLRNVGHNTDYRLHVANGFIQFLDVYIFSNNGKPERIARYNAGSSLPRYMGNRDRQPAFRLPHMQEDFVLLVRVQTKSRIRIPITLVKESQYEIQEGRQRTVFLVFYGMLIVLFVTNVLGFVGLRDRRYMELNGFLLLLLLYQTYLDQFWPAGPGQSTWIFQLLASTGPASLTMLSVFLGSFLDVSRQNRSVWFLIRFMQICGLILALLVLIDYQWGISGVIYTMWLWFVGLFAIVALSYRESRTEARYLSWAIFVSLPLPALIALSDAILGWDTLSYLHLTRLFILPGGLILTVSVTLRLNNINRERQEALEEAVRERTRQLMTESLRSEEAGKIKDNVLRIVSHDIRSPLAALKTNLPLLRKSGLSSEVREELVHEMESTVDELLHLSNWLLESSRAGSGKPGLEPRWQSIQKALDDIATRYSSSSNEAAFRIQVSAPEDWEFLIDPPLFASMISNLISNALPHMGSDGTLDLVANLEEDFVLRIIDNGSGIPAELQPALFDPTRTGRNQEVTPGRGHGLGLILSREIALLHGGELELEHSVPGNTVFVFRMPRNRIYIPGHEMSRGQSIVLLVDDDPAFRQMVRTLFYQADPGLATVEASNTRQALRILRELKPRLILTDVWMPGEDGFHLIQSLAGDEGFSRIPVWAISADGTTEKRARSYPNVTEFLEKPIQPERLKKRFIDFSRGNMR